MIRSGLLKPDQQLPPERELAAMLGVGHPAVREAIRGLALLGCCIRQGEGTFVSSLETRELLEPLEMIIDLNPGAGGAVRRPSHHRDRRGRTGRHPYRGRRTGAFGAQRGG
jgi:DNA-binding FadR family transcriptional regulator